jgi:Ca2+-binding EF-hand superfamily protein
MRTTRILSFFCIFVITSAYGYDTVEGYLAAFDSNQDGKVALGEYQSKLSFAFHQRDRNHDDILQADEQVDRRLKPLRLSEHQARIARQFKRQDRNHDGYLSAKELAAPPQ